MNSYPILNKYEDIICIKMNQNNKFIILLIIYIVLLNIFRPIFQSILYIIKKKRIHTSKLKFIHKIMIYWKKDVLYEINS
jgi:hypothetical protein